MVSIEHEIRARHLAVLIINGYDDPFNRRRPLYDMSDNTCLYLPDLFHYLFDSRLN